MARHPARPRVPGTVAPGPVVTAFAEAFSGIVAPVRRVLGRRAARGAAEASTRSTRTAMPARTALVLLLTGVVLLPLVPRGPLGGITPVPLPAFFTGPGAARIPDGSTVLVLPLAGRSSSIAMTWQAEAGLRWRMVGGYFVGPDATGRPKFGGPPSAFSHTVSMLRRGQSYPDLGGERRRGLIADLVRWNVGTIVLGPDRDQAAIAQLVTTLLGRPPRTTGGVLVWYDVAPVSLLGPRGGLSGRV
jgi:hypothetical protein